MRCIVESEESIPRLVFVDLAPGIATGARFLTALNEIIAGPWPVESLLTVVAPKRTGINESDFDDIYDLTLQEELEGPKL